MNSKLKIVFFLVVFVLISLRYGTEARHHIGGINNKILATYVDGKQFLEDKINEHIGQEEEIVKLRAENIELQKSAILSKAFASKLNQLLRENQSESYAPNVKLVKSIGYSNLNDYGKVWIDYSDFNKTRIYGLLHQGYVAGIVVENDGRPQGLLLGDPKSIFAVYVGSQKMQGVTHGNGKELFVRYISQWLQPQVGDEVVTSGLDGIFFEGVKVGVVTQIIEEESSKTAIVKPYIIQTVPAYMHIVTQN